MFVPLNDNHETQWLSLFFAPFLKTTEGWRSDLPQTTSCSRGCRILKSSILAQIHQLTAPCTLALIVFVLPPLIRVITPLTNRKCRLMNRQETTSGLLPGERTLSLIWNRDKRRFTGVHRAQSKLQAISHLTGDVSIGFKHAGPTEVVEGALPLKQSIFYVFAGKRWTCWSITSSE